jgi:hypothetical protein
MDACGSNAARAAPPNPARALYERLGFRIVGDDPHRYYLEWTAAI